MTSKQISSLILMPIILTLCWNYGFTEVIQNLGGPDANVNLLDGALATYFMSALMGMAYGGTQGWTVKDG